MKKQFKPVVTSVMVLALGFSLAACSQNSTMKEKSMRVKNDMTRVEDKIIPYGTTHNGTTPYGTNRNGIAPYGVNNDGMTRYGTTDDGITPYATNHSGLNGTGTRMNSVDPLKAASHLANRAEMVTGVKKATVVVHNHDAIVGLDIDNPGKKAIIEKQVHAALKGQYPAYNIHVTSDQNMHQKIKSMSGNLTSGHPIKTLANDVAIMIRDIGNAITAPLR
ncbi:YhcN/YlaJ family sporulation lipoprotein [Bacillus sp. FJAT-26390]|uniref:YhcN/YlaJ family sporulation lipoprotein n=1 Tax=Bacillus sp. FJAT-26390 TaxID=1743142 RepID=UPI000807E4C0|nr:YhcN/YlaJ family sporulation lipoprotein [Bacillus sp. FJAT-26390]OBZ09281.1 hypothetical protein A7975_24545 [Bacillus sp. FJAT-26390]